VLDGIRVNASVGYIIHDLVLEKQEEDVATYRVTDWEPLEGSLVAVPADPTVGVGRELEPPAPPTPSQGDSMTPKKKSKRCASKSPPKSARRSSAKSATRPPRAANTPEAVAARASASA
jgi:hypothetical protein